MGSEPDTERTVVQVYVPGYQRDRWDEHADELGMNRSEFVKAMVQAGRRGFGADTEGSEATSEADSGTTALHERVTAALETRGPLSWEELLAEVSDDIEARLEATLQALQDERRVRYSGRAGGYVLENEDE